MDRGDANEPHRDEAIVRHLKLAASCDEYPGVASQAHELLAALNVSQNRLDTAADHLTAAAEQKPELLLDAWRTYKLQGDEASAQAAAEAARDRFADLAARTRKDSQLYLQWADALVLLRRYSEAEEALLAGFRKTNDDQLRAALTTLYLGWFDESRRSPSANGAECLSLLQRALRHAPQEPRIWRRLAELCVGSRAIASEARTLFEQARREGEVPPEALAASGALAFRNGDLKAARELLEEAYQLDPADPATTNNLAWVLAHANPPALERALQLADQAVVAAPDNPRYRDTRGRILYRLERPHEALTDLELALHSMSGDAGLHRILAALYEKLGDETLAAEHRRQAKP
jgi:predicted Zn-dependent protease